jgi:hypothetical protein
MSGQLATKPARAMLDLLGEEGARYLPNATRR